MLRSALLQLSASPAAKRAAMDWPVARRVAGRFVAGTALEDALDTVERLNRGGCSAALNYLGEHTTTREEAAAATEAYLQAIDAVAERRLRAYLSAKPSQMGLQIDEALCRDHVRRLVARAREQGTFVRLDMEDSSTTASTLRIVRELRAEGFENLGVVLQSYLYRTDQDIEDLNALGVSVRLCKGAYREPPDVAYPEKAEVDRAYARQMVRLLVAGHQPALATHDPRLVRAAVRHARTHGIDQGRYSFEMLLGIRRDLQERLVTSGDRITVYVPYGGEWYPYLMRRLAERPANLLFFLRGALR